MVTGPNILERVRARLLLETTDLYNRLGYWSEWRMREHAEKALDAYMADVRPIPRFLLTFQNNKIEVKVWFPDEAA